MTSRAADVDSSARKPLVQTYTQIREPAMLRKLSAAGAQATLSPARRAPIRDNAQAGPSSVGKRMERLKEEEEPIEELVDENVQEDEVKPRGYEAAVRERELAAQKARIVSQMATPVAVRRERMASPRKEHERSSPRKPVLTSARSVPAALPTSAEAQPRLSSSSKLAEPSTKPKPYRPVTSKSGLFDRIRRNLEHAVEMSKTPAGYQGPGEYCADLDGACPLTQ